MHCTQPFIFAHCKLHPCTYISLSQDVHTTHTTRDVHTRDVHTQDVHTTHSMHTTRDVRTRGILRIQRDVL